MATCFATVEDINLICELLGQLGSYNDTDTFMRSKLQSVIEHPDHYLLVDDNNGATLWEKWGIPICLPNPPILQTGCHFLGGLQGQKSSGSKFTNGLRHGFVNTS